MKAIDFTYFPSFIVIVKLQHSSMYSVCGLEKVNFGKLVKKYSDFRFRGFLLITIEGLSSENNLPPEVSTSSENCSLDSVG